MNEKHQCDAETEHVFNLAVYCFVFFPIILNVISLFDSFGGY